MKKQKSFLLKLALTLCCCLSLALAACSGGESGATCEHDWQNTNVVTEATCGTAGVQEQKCTKCNETQTIEIPALNHEFGTEWSYSETEHWLTATCEHTTEKSQLAAHSFDGGKVTQPITADAAGEVVYTCTVCDYEKTAVITEDHTEHIYEWFTNSKKHWKEMTCCNASDEITEEGEHVYGKDSVCTVCGQFSIFQAVKDQLSSTQSGTFYLYDLALAVNRETVIYIDELALQVAFDENASPVLRGRLLLDEEKPIVFGDLTLEGTEDIKTNNIAGIDFLANTEGVYVKMLEEANYLSVIDAERDFEIYASFTWKELLSNAYWSETLESLKTIVGEVLEQVYAMSDQIKEAVDVIAALTDKLPAADQQEFLQTFFVAETVGEETYYRFSFDVFYEFNQFMSEQTIDGLLQLLIGEDYQKTIPAFVTSSLNLTVGGMIDALKLEGIDIHKLNEQANALLANFNITLEQIIVAYAGLPIPDGMTVAEFIDSAAIRAYKVIDIINMFVGNADSAITVEQIVGTISETIASLKDYEIYQLIADVFTYYKYTLPNQQELENDVKRVDMINEELDRYLKEKNLELNFINVQQFVIDRTGMVYSWGYATTIYWHQQTGKFVLIDQIYDVKIIYPFEQDVTEEDVFWYFAAKSNTDTHSITLSNFTIYQPQCVTKEYVTALVEEIFVTLDEFLRIDVTLNETFTQIESWVIGFGVENVIPDSDVIIKSANDDYGGELVPEDDYGGELVPEDENITELRGMFTKLRAQLAIVNGKFTITNDYKFEQSNEKLIAEVTKALQGVLPEEAIDWEKGLKAYFEEDGYTFKNETVEIVEKDGREKLFYSFDRVRRVPSIENASGACLDITESFCYGGYLDEILKAYAIYDQCGSDGVYGYVFLLEYSITRSFNWTDNPEGGYGTGTALTDEEIAAIKENEAYSLYWLFMEEFEDGVTIVTLFGRYTKENGYVWNTVLSDFNPTGESEIHTWVLDEKSSVYTTVYTKKVYVCSACGEKFVVYELTDDLYI